MRRRRLLGAVGTGVFLVLTATAMRAGDPDTAALPDLPVFLREIRDRLHSDEFLLDQYTFTERHRERRLDGKGKIRTQTEQVYEVYPSPEPGHTYRRLVERDGKPLSSAELVREDHKQEEREAKASAADGQKQAARREERRRKEEEIIGELFRVYDIRIAGRETLEGRTAILLVFQPRPGTRAATKAGKILQKFEGRAWIDEQDRQLVRVEAKLVDNLSFGFGILAKLKKGATISVLRRKVNDEIWLPAEARFVGQARFLLVKGVRLDELSEYSDYRKFSVATETAMTPDRK